MEAGADLHPPAMRRRGQRLRAADAARRPVEGCEEAVADGLDGGAAVVAELLSSCPLVRLEELAPAAVAGGGGGPGGGGEGGEEEAGEKPGARGGLAAVRVESTMSVNRTVARTRSRSAAWRLPVRNSSISPRTRSLSPNQGGWSSPGSSASFAFGRCSASQRPCRTLTRRSWVR